jgi:hypothetical protein
MKCPKCQSENNKKVSAFDPLWKVGNQRCLDCNHQGDWFDFQPLKIEIKRAPEPEKPSNLFCDKCCKIVPAEQIKYNHANAFVAEGFWSHTYQAYVNLASPSSGMNCCMGYEWVYCGNVREPTAEEYFMYVTCPMKE